MGVRNKMKEINANHVATCCVLRSGSASNLFEPGKDAQESLHLPTVTLSRMGPVQGWGFGPTPALYPMLAALDLSLLMRLDLVPSFLLSQERTRSATTD